MSSDTKIVWLRRDLQIADNASFFKALQNGGKVQPVFVFDTDILCHFPDKMDKRVSFIAATIHMLGKQIAAKGGRLAVFYGSARKIIPSFNLPVFAGEDYEPDAIKRDSFIAQSCKLILTKQHVLLSPTEILKPDNTPYKVFTPYSKAWISKLNLVSEYKIVDSNRYANLDLKNTIDISTPEMICKAIGYKYIPNDIWQPEKAHIALQEFAKNRLISYANNRDFPAINGTAQISPYLRFGLLTPRQCYLAAGNNDKWFSEIIWREFYSQILYHYPNTIYEEFLPQYRNLEWGRNEELILAWQEGKTGYDIIDAGMRQLNQTGWMHNRVRMLVASFFAKNLLQDWRIGEAYFAQKLMDYDAASNIGGWQWCASVGTDAAPYFRVFNPITQAKKFDPDRRYISKYISEFEQRSSIVSLVGAKEKVTRFFKQNAS